MNTGTLSNTPAEAFSRNDLTLSDNGVFTLCPSLHLELHVAWTEGPEMLDFYRRCREVLGEALKWYTIGSGHLSKLSPRVDPMVTTWFERPVPFPKKMYTLIMQGTAEGITPASFEIHCRIRPYQPTTPALMARWRNPDIDLNLPHSLVRISFPVDHPILNEPERFVDWVKELQVIKASRIITGVAGYCIDYSDYYPTSDEPWHRETWDQSGERAAALVARHPGLDLKQSKVGVGVITRRNFEYLDRVRVAEGQAFVKRVNWLTILGEGQVTFLGGLDKLREQLAPMPSIKLHPLAHGLIIQAGPAPRLGDARTGDIPPEYVTVAKALAPISLHRIVQRSMPVDLEGIYPLGKMGKYFKNEGADLWLNFFKRG